MKAVLQRVSWARVSVEKELIGQIGPGFLVLLGIAADDNEEDLKKMVDKIIKLRVFNDEQGKMNKSLIDIAGELLCVSQFTLFADSSKGNRPSFVSAAPSTFANELYEKFCQSASKALGRPIQKGKFGSDMEVELLNQGPVTIIINTKE
jgi:D-tyrosyl-tRNA(Tyr) deacylase